MKKEPFVPANHYLIKNSGNNFETLFLEQRNYSYFLALFEKHVGQIATLHAFRFFSNEFELLITFKDNSEIPLKYQDRLHQPFSNFFNAYCKAINKMYGRSGSLFREHFRRMRIDDFHFENLKRTMNESPVTRKNMVVHKVPKHVGMRPQKRETSVRKLNSIFLRFAASVTLFFLLNACSNPPKSVENPQIPEDTIATILKSYLPKLKEFESKDTIFRPFGAIEEFDTIQHLAIGRFVDGKTPYAVHFTFKDSMISFYRFEHQNWNNIGREKMKIDNINLLHFEDLDSDGNNEIILETHPNMNGNTGICIYYASRKSAKIHLAGFMFGRYEAAPNQKLHYIYEGSYYADFSQTLYEWKNEKLLPVRDVTISPVNPENSDKNWLIYSERAVGSDTLTVKCKYIYKPKDKRDHYIVDHIFDENFQFK
ncbi:hypothetical protein [Flavobacterium sp.]|uniref:hypothetical protein n=1 Tax=Flavobacterium sp. TaxID=239 RepID=UPI001226EB78|nr:hypothetical protein [Flavobacterium sp.]RZJ73908.1 MAG: hypothetical protein EOO49_00705 [Flavobacterium sp.]